MSLTVIVNEELSDQMGPKQQICVPAQEEVQATCNMSRVTAASQKPVLLEDVTPSNCQVLNCTAMSIY